MSFTCLGQSRNLWQGHSRSRQYYPSTFVRWISDNKLVETSATIKAEDKEKKTTKKKYIYYKSGKPKYSTGEPLSTLHVSRISNKHFFGPLLETKKEKNSREKREKKDLLLKDPDESTPENLFRKIQNSTVKKKKMNNAGFDEGEYDRIAVLYSEMYYTAKPVKVNTNKSSNNTLSHTKNCISSELPCPIVSAATTSVTAEHPLPSAKFQPTQQTSSNFESVQPASNASSNVIEVDNCKYEDAPRYLDLHCLQSFPLFRENSNTHLSPFNVHSPFSNPEINSLEATEDVIIETALKNDTFEDQSTDGVITSINYLSSGTKSLPSVSRILSETMPEASKIALAKWEAKMIAELGEKGFQDYKRELFSQGSQLHKCIHAHLLDSEPPSASALSRIEGFWRSVEPVVAEVQQGKKVTALESRVIHPHLHYAGILDCVAVYRDTPVIVEWKTSTKPKRTLKMTYDNPLQVAAYLGAMQHDPVYRHLQVQSGLLAFAYSDGSSSDTHVLSRTKLEHYWRMWLNRLATFWKMNSVGTSVRQETSKNS